MNVPASSRRRALAIIDVQKEFVASNSSGPVANIKKLIASVPYNLYVEALFSAEPGSLWDRQTGWSLPHTQEINTIKGVASTLENRRVFQIQKHTKSAFKGDPNLLSILRAHRIDELHLVGFDLNDCVMASAFDSFDHGIFTYVIEECCGASRGTDLRTQAINLLRYLNLTNNSIYEPIPVITV
jgi:nicotinamidase-related amidase